MSHGFMMTRRVQFAETDAARVLHFANYFRYMEEIEHAFWRSLKMSVMMDYEGKCLSWPRVAADCEYFAPAYFEDELDLSLTLSHVGERSLTYEVEFRRGQERIALGKTTAVCCFTNDGHFQSTAIPESIRSVLLPFTQED